VSPSTVNGRAPPVLTTGGGAPPRVPVNVWAFDPVAAALLAAALAAGLAALAADTTGDAAAEAAVLETAGVALVDVLDAAAETPRAELKASAAAWPVKLAAAVSPASQAVTAAALALQDEES